MKQNKILPEETILPDDYPVYPGYVYIVGRKKDNKTIYITQRWWFPYAGDILQWKKYDPEIQEVRKCSLFSHLEVRLGEELFIDQGGGYETNK